MFHFAVPPPPPPPPPLELYLLDAYTRGFRDASSAACSTGGASAAHAPPLLPTAFPYSHCHTAAAAAAAAAPPAVVPVSAQTAAQTPAVRTAASSAATLAPPPPRKRARQEDGGTGVASGGGGGGGKDASGGEATDDDDDDDDGDEEDGGEIVLYQKGDLAKGAGAGSAVHRDRAGEEGWEGEGEEEEEEVLSDEGGAPAADAPAAEGSSVNDAWISMFVDSEKRRRAKAAEKEEERKRFARRPVEREDERRLAERTAMYGADAAREVAKAECRLHALHGRRARGRKFPAWPCVPVYFDPNSLEERKLGFHGASGDGGGAPLLIQTRALSAAERERGVVPAEACKEAT